LIPFLRIIFSGLHAGIGIGNRLIDHLEEFIDVDVENISHKEFQLHASKESSEKDIKHFRDLKHVWTKSPDGGRLLQKKRGRIKRLDVELNQSLVEESIAIKSAEKNSLNRDINTLIISRDEYTNSPLKNMMDGNLVFPVPPDDIIKKRAQPTLELLWVSGLSRCWNGRRMTGGSAETHLIAVYIFYSPLKNMVGYKFSLSRPPR